MHWEPREGSGFPKIYKAPYGNVQAHTKSLQTKKPQNSGFSIDILTKYQKKKI